MKPIIIAGPCVIESQECLYEVAKELVRLNKKYDLDYSHYIGLDSFPLCYNACEAYS